jgi:hypothetical protein
MIALIENMIIEAPTNTAGNAKIKICIACFLKMYQSELNALSKIKGGRKINSMPLGSIFDIVLIDYPIMPMSFEKYPSPTLTKNNVGV